MKFEVNFKELNSTLTKQSVKTYKYSEVKDRLVKVAFDIVKFRDKEDIDGLWQIQNTDDGEVIVAKYDDDNTKDTVNKTSSWSAISDRSGENITVFYKNEAITNIKVASVGFAPAESEFVCSYLPEKLATNDKLRKSLLGFLPEDRQAELLVEFPELGK